MSLQVILKIIKHCEEVGSELSQGVLLGLLIGNSLEITNCFPFPRNALDDPEFDEGVCVCVCACPRMAMYTRCLFLIVSRCCI